MPIFAWPLAPATSPPTLQFSNAFMHLGTMLTQHVKVLAAVNSHCAYFNTKELNIQEFLLCLGFRLQCTARIIIS